MMKRLTSLRTHGACFLVRYRFRGVAKASELVAHSRGYTLHPVVLEVPEYGKPGFLTSGDEKKRELPYEAGDGREESSEHIDCYHTRRRPGARGPAPDVQIEQYASGVRLDPNLLLDVIRQSVDISSDTEHEDWHRRHKIAARSLNEVHGLFKGAIQDGDLG